MNISKKISKRDFIQHPIQYIKWVEEHGSQLVITHHNHPALVLSKLKVKTLKGLRGYASVKIYGDINEPVLLSCYIR